MKRIPLPSPAMVMALIALFVAAGGTAVAAGIVPLAKRALVADNAKKLNNQTLSQIASGLGAAVPALVNVKSQPWSLNPTAGNDFSVACDTGQKAISGGYDNPTGDAIALDTRPSADGTGWRIFLLNISNSASASGTAYAVCLA